MQPLTHVRHPELGCGITMYNQCGDKNHYRVFFYDHGPVWTYVTSLTETGVPMNYRIFEEVVLNYQNKTPEISDDQEGLFDGIDFFI